MKIRQIGYLPGYGNMFDHTWTRDFQTRISISCDTTETDEHADFRVLIQCEPPVLFRDFYGYVMDTWKRFDLILTYDHRLLELPTSRLFLPVGTWVDPELRCDKQAEISFLMSSKIWSPDHRMRYRLLRYIENHDMPRGFRLNHYRSPPRIPDKNQMFRHAQFSIITENQCMDDMFTEKLIDCFVTRTVPMYYGCTNLHKYFDTQGILSFRTMEEFHDLVQGLDLDRYQDLRASVERNRELSRPYWSQTVYQRIEEIIGEHVS